MIYRQTYLNVADNTGARKIMCIGILGNNKSYGSIGDIIVGVIKDTIPNTLIKKSDVIRALIIRTKVGVHRTDGMRIKFNENAAVIVNKDNNPLGTRIFGPVTRELRDKNFLKVLSLSSEVV